MTPPTRIMVIDDDEDLRGELMELLQAIRFDVEGYGSATEARLRIDAVDVILCDLDLGAESGVELIHQIQALEESRRPGVIAMSGRVDLLNLFEDTTNIPLLPKPTKVSTLVDKIRLCEAAKRLP